MSITRKFAFASSLALIAVSVAQAQNLDRAGQTPTTGTGSGFYPSPLHHRNDVSKSLNLSRDQLDRLNDATSGLQKRYREDVEKLGTLNQKDRETRSQQLLDRYHTDWYKSASGILNEEQRNRYSQLDLQHRGFSAFNDPDVQKRLNLTPEQQKQITEGQTWSRQQWQDINKRGAADSAEGTRLYEGYQKEYQQRLDKILTPEQQKTWRGMTGEGYRFPPAFATPRR